MRNMLVWSFVVVALGLWLVLGGGSDALAGEDDATDSDRYAMKSGDTDGMQTAALESGRLAMPDAGDMTVRYFSNVAFDEENLAITRVVIVIHGTERNADEYFEGMSAAAENAGKLAQTLIVAPRFMISEDNPENGELYWTYNSGWKKGGLSSPDFDQRISSFAVIDVFIRNLIGSGNFANLNEIVVTGHSAGGQMVQRYACWTRIESETGDVSVRYIPMNPSSYMYLNGLRAKEGSQTAFEVPVTTCTEYNDYKYGPDNLNDAMESVGIVTIRNQYRTRDVIYMLGALDNDPNANELDLECPAMLQGSHRLERGKIYFNYLGFYYEQQPHTLEVVAGVGHSYRDMFDSPVGRRYLFGGEIVDTDGDADDTSDGDDVDGDAGDDVDGDEGDEVDGDEGDDIDGDEGDDIDGDAGDEVDGDVGDSTNSGGFFVDGDTTEPDPSDSPAVEEGGCQSPGGWNASVLMLLILLAAVARRKTLGSRSV